MIDETVHLAEKLALIDEHFRPKIVAAFNDQNDVHRSWTRSDDYAQARPETGERWST